MITSYTPVVFITRRDGTKRFYDFGTCITKREAKKVADILGKKYEEIISTNEDVDVSKIKIYVVSSLRWNKKKYLQAFTSILHGDETYWFKDNSKEL